MADDQQAVAVPQPGEQEAPAPRLTRQAFADEANALIDRAEASDLQWGPALATIVAKRGMSLFDQVRAGLADAAERLLVSLEGGNAKATKK